MKFFTDADLRRARKNSKRELRRNYRDAERALKRAAGKGASDARLTVLMQRHRDAEYALLAKRRLEHKSKKLRGKRK